MDIITKINLSRKQLRKYLENEWDVSPIQEYSNKELERLYNMNTSKLSNIASFGNATGCNFSLSHKHIPSHQLHVIYYNFPELGRPPLKVTKTCGDKIKNLYTEGIINPDDSILIIILENISENLEKTIDDLYLSYQEELELTGLSDTILTENSSKEIPFQYSKEHFKNIHIFTINSLTIDLTQHKHVPKHECIRDKKMIEKICKDTNAHQNQLPIILRKDPQAKILRLARGDVCKIIRKTNGGEVIYYRVCN